MDGRNAKKTVRQLDGQNNKQMNRQKSGWLDEWREGEREQQANK